jgi:hypothetical protein
MLFDPSVRRQSSSKTFPLWNISLSGYFRPSKLPLSAFIVEDMTEFVEAHASYRFIILDEEEERARILVCFVIRCASWCSYLSQVWLFKPNMRLAYTTQTQYALPRSASIRTAKVLYKLLGPSEATTDLQRCVIFLRSGVLVLTEFLAVS